MKIVIMGCGKVGSNLAALLISDGHDVILIEKDIGKCKEATMDLDTIVIRGNGADPNILEEAEIDHADAFAAVTGSDEVNYMASSIARDYKVPKIIARVTDPHHEKVFQEAGINILVRPETIVAENLKKIITD